MKFPPLQKYMGLNAMLFQQKKQIYLEIGDRQAAIEEGVPVRWGCAWHIDNIEDYDGTMEDAMNAYIDLRRSQGKRPFLDGPHFELA